MATSLSAVEIITNLLRKTNREVDWRFNLTHDSAEKFNKQIAQHLATVRGTD